MQLSINSKPEAGGQNLWVKIINNDIGNCETNITKESKDFYPGDIIVWKNEDLGSCNYIISDASKVLFQLKTNKSDQFFPNELKIFLKNSEFITYKSEELNQWYGVFTNEKTHIATQELGGCKVKSQ